MKIKKYKHDNNVNWFYYYYEGTDNRICHGLYNDYSWSDIGYYYHDIKKGFWLSNKDLL